LLFLGALILPSLAITALGWRVIVTERELEQKRLEDTENRTVDEIRNSITERLERIKNRDTARTSGLQDSGYSAVDPALVLVAKVDDTNRMVLAQEADPGPEAEQFKKSVMETDFARKAAAAEHVELAERNDEKAARLYRELVPTARNASQRNYGRVLLARVLSRSRNGGGAMNAEARGIYQDLLKLPTTDVDDKGVPFAFYAAARLVLLTTDGTDLEYNDQGFPFWAGPFATMVDLKPVDAGEHEDQVVLDRAILDRVTQEITSSGGSPPKPYILKGVLGNLRYSKDSAVQQTAEAAFDRLSKGLAYREQVSELQEDFYSLGVTSTDWRIYKNPELWLLGMSTPTDSAPTTVFAVHAPTVFKDISESLRNREPWLHARIEVGGNEGKALGANLPKLRAVFPPGRDVEIKSALREHQSFYVLSLLVVLGLTFLAGYLMWRDTRREMRIADLRSQFVSSVSHELKTPLTSIRMFAETLQMRHETDRQTHSRYLDTIVNETERLTRLLNNVLDFSKIERDKRGYHMAPTALDELVDAVASSMQYPLSQQGFNLRVEIAEMRSSRPF
jgi:hypothetical protein